MKKKLVLSLGLFTLIASTLSMGAYAGANLEEVKAFLNKGIKVNLNGHPLQITDSAGQATAPLTYKGTTWLPVRAIGDALRVNIGWDAKANAVDIKSNAIPTLTTADDLKSYLISNYSILKTSIGYTSFKFDIAEHTSIDNPNDYWVQINYNKAFFEDLQIGDKITADQRVIVKNELRLFSEKIGRDLAEKVSNKKIDGGYFRTWYEDAAETNLIMHSYYSWSNYQQLPNGNAKAFAAIKPSTFRWVDLIDDEL
jgi:hypothetical protein